MTDRSADEIQRDIERARASLAVAVDQIAYRTSPKRALANAKRALIAKAKTPQGAAVLGGVGLLAAVVVIRRVRKKS